MFDLLDSYKELVVANAARVHSVEKSLRTLSYMLPVCACLKLVGALHDRILTQALAERQAPANGGTVADAVAARSFQASPFNRYLDYCRQQSALTEKVLSVLSAIQFVQALLEMAVQKRMGTQHKWRLVLWIEVLKAAARLFLLKQTHTRLTIQPPHKERSDNFDGLIEHLQKDAGTLEQERYWRGPRAGKVYSSVDHVLESAGSDGPFDASSFVAFKRPDPESLLSSEQLVRPLSGVALLGEVVFLLRPVLYIVALRRFGAKSWVPWVLSLSLEILARQAIRGLWNHQLTAATSVEQKELHRRDYLFLHYLLRDPFYERYFSPLLDRIWEKTKDRTVVSFFTAWLKDYQPLWKSSYFYTSGA